MIVAILLYALNLVLFAIILTQDSGLWLVWLGCGVNAWVTVAANLFLLGAFGDRVADGELFGWAVGIFGFWVWLSRFNLPKNSFSRDRLAQFETPPLPEVPFGSVRNGRKFVTATQHKKWVPVER